MNKFLKYILPVGFFVVVFGVSTFINNQFVLFVGWLISLIWLNRVASAFKNRVLTISTTLFIVVTIVWAVGLLLWAFAW